MLAFTYMTELKPILVPSHYKVKSDYLLIFMAKAKQGNKWSHITHAEKVCKLYSIFTAMCCVCAGGG